MSKTTSSDVAEDLWQQLQEDEYATRKKAVNHSRTIAQVAHRLSSASKKSSSSKKTKKKSDKESTRRKANLPESLAAARKASEIGVVKLQPTASHTTASQPIEQPDHLNGSSLLLLSESDLPMTEMLEMLNRQVRRLAGTESSVERRRALEQLSEYLFPKISVSTCGTYADPARTIITAVIESYETNRTDNAIVSKSSNHAVTSSFKGIIGAQPDSDDEDEKSMDEQHTSQNNTSANYSARVRGRLCFRLLVKTLAKCLSDETERCREMALALLIRLIPLASKEDLTNIVSMPASLQAIARSLPPSIDLCGTSIVPLLLSALTERIPHSWSYSIEQNQFIPDVSKHEAFKRGRVIDQGIGSTTIKVVEPAEELRFLLARCFAVLFETARRCRAMHDLDSFLHDFILAAHALAIDPFPTLKIEGCNLLKELGLHAPHAMQHFCIGAAKSLAEHGVLTHRHAKVRMAALNCLNALVQVPNPAKRCAAGASAIAELVGFREENVIPVAAFYGKDMRKNYFGLLCSDANNQVRHRFFEIVSEWLIHLPPADLYEQEARLLPYLLVGMSDTYPPIASDALSVMDRLGIRYEQQHKDEINEKKQYGIDGNPDIDYTKPLPEPFNTLGRPRLGARLFVRANVRRFLKPVIQELADPGFGPNSLDTESTRISAARLLCTLIVFLEESITEEAQSLLGALCTLIGESGSKAAVENSTGLRSSQCDLSILEIGASIRSSGSIITKDSLGSSKTIAQPTFTATNGAARTGEHVIADLGARATRLAGRFMDPATYIGILLPAILEESMTSTVARILSKAPTDAAAVGRTLRVLALLISEAPSVRILHHVSAICSAITVPRVVSLVSSTRSSASHGLAFLHHGLIKCYKSQMHAEQSMNNTKLSSFDDFSIDSGWCVPDEQVRLHFVSVITAIAKILFGRVGSAASAFFANKGRFSSIQSCIRSLICGTLTVLDVESRLHALSLDQVPAGLRLCLEFYSNATSQQKEPSDIKGELKPSLTFQRSISLLFILASLDEASPREWVSFVHSSLNIEQCLHSVNIKILLKTHTHDIINTCCQQLTAVPSWSSSLPGYAALRQLIKLAPCETIALSWDTLVQTANSVLSRNDWATLTKINAHDKGRISCWREVTSLVFDGFSRLINSEDLVNSSLLSSLSLHVLGLSEREEQTCQDLLGWYATQDLQVLWLHFWQTLCTHPKFISSDASCQICKNAALCLLNWMNHVQSIELATSSSMSHDAATFSSFVRIELLRCVSLSVKLLRQEKISDGLVSQLILLHLRFAVDSDSRVQCLALELLADLSHVALAKPDANIENDIHESDWKKIFDTGLEWLRDVSILTGSSNGISPGTESSDTILGRYPVIALAYHMMQSLVAVRPTMAKMCLSQVLESLDTPSNCLLHDLEEHCHTVQALTQSQV